MEFIWSKAGTSVAQDAFNLRYSIFVVEQGFPPASEADATDAHAWHLAGYENGEAVCAARLFWEAGTAWHAGRIVVARSHRGKGFGAQLMQQLADKARSLGAQTLVLGAQADKAGFYAACGYISTGHEYLDENYPHVEMCLTL